MSAPLPQTLFCVLALAPSPSASSLAPKRIEKKTGSQSLFSGRSLKLLANPLARVAQHPTPVLTTGKACLCSRINGREYQARRWQISMGGGPSSPNSPKSPLFVRVPPYLHTKIFPMGGGPPSPPPPLSDGLGEYPVKSCGNAPSRGGFGESPEIDPISSRLHRFRQLSPFSTSDYSGASGCSGEPNFLFPPPSLFCLSAAVVSFMRRETLISASFQAILGRPFFFVRL